MRAARFWVAVDVQTLGLGLGLGLCILGLRVSCKRAANGVHTRPGLGRGSHVHFTYSAHARDHTRAARFWVAMDVQTLGLL